MQQDALLATKLFIPLVRPELVIRRRLIEQLNAGIHRKLTLVSAPAGFGKTTLLSDWIASNDFPVAWLSLDENDNDPARFLTYLIAAVQTVDRSIGEGLMAALQSPEPVNPDIILTSFINEIALRSDRLLLVLDDYHVIETQVIDQAMTFLLDNLPPSMHLVIATRTDPIIPLSRLRARGQLSELRADDLRFTIDETTVFLKQATALPLHQNDCTTLEKRTEGWITGLQLAAVAIRNYKHREEIARFVDSFSGSHRYVIDYLVDEVLDQQSPLIKTFLLRTAILERLTAPLCNAMTGREDSQTLLEQLETANLFLIPLDGERRWYRYHHLFADLLVHRLTQTSPELIPELHSLASEWYESEGDTFTDDAFRHAQQAGDTKQAIRIVEEHWQDSIHTGQLAVLRRWLDTLGPENTKTSAPLSMAWCWIHHLTGGNALLPACIQDTRRAYKIASLAHNGQPEPKLVVIPALIETMESIVALNNKQAASAKVHAQKAISLIPIGADMTMRNLLHGASGYRLAMAHRTLGEYDRARAVLLDVLEMLKSSQNLLGIANTVWTMAAVYREIGDTREAIAVCENILEYIHQFHLERMPSSGIVYLVLANLHADSGNLDAATRYLNTGQKLVEPLVSPQVFNFAERIKTKLDNLTTTPQPLIEPLSKRELQVLELIAQGFSNREIGEQLYLALDTVKGHNRNIYAKLAVKNRTQAINAARLLGIL